MTHPTHARITGTGSFAPPRRMTNADLESLVDTTDQWIRERTGIRERRIADDSISCSDMAVAAARNAMDMAHCAPEDVDLLVLDVQKSKTRKGMP